MVYVHRILIHYNFFIFTVRKLYLFLLMRVISRLLLIKANDYTVYSIFFLQIY